MWTSLSATWRPALLAVLLCTSLPGLALADAAGSARGVNPAADANAKGAIRTLTVGSDIFIGDLVETGPSGQVQIVFADNTHLVVGPHSSLTIDDYLIRNNGDPGKLVVDMLSGSFRFATGNAPKDKYLIDTPTGTIGVRGTGFDVFVDTDGVTRILHYHGIVHYCSLANVCEDISDACTVGEFDSKVAHIIGDSRLIKGPARNQLKAEFIYAQSQSPLLHDFWMSQAYDCLHNPPDVTIAPHDPGVTVPPPPPPKKR